MRLFRRKNKKKKQLQRQVDDLQGEVKFLQKRLLSMHVKYNDAKYDQQQKREQKPRFESKKLCQTDFPDPLQQDLTKSTKVNEMPKIVPPETAFSSSSSQSLFAKDITRKTILQNESRILEREVVNECRQDHSSVQRGESLRKSPSFLSKDIVVHVTEEEPDNSSDDESLEESETHDYFIEEPRVPIKVLLRPKSIVYKWNRYADMEENGFEVSPRRRTKLAKAIEAQKQRKRAEAMQHSQKKDTNFNGSSCRKTSLSEEKAHNSEPTMDDFLTELRAKQQGRMLRLQSS